MKCTIFVLSSKGGIGPPSPPISNIQRGEKYVLHIVHLNVCGVGGDHPLLVKCTRGGRVSFRGISSVVRHWINVIKIWSYHYMDSSMVKNSKLITRCVNFLVISIWATLLANYSCCSHPSTHPNGKNLKAAAANHARLGSHLDFAGLSSPRTVICVTLLGC